MNRATVLLAAIVLPFALSACAASQSSYPSLSKRSAERYSASASAVDAESSPSEPPAMPGGLPERLARIGADAESAHATFLARRPSAERIILAGSGSPRTSDPWIAGQVALAGLDAARSETYISLAELDDMFVAERIAYPAGISPAAEAIASARARVEALAGMENAVLAALRGKLGS